MRVGCDAVVGRRKHFQREPSSPALAVHEDRVGEWSHPGFIAGAGSVAQAVRDPHESGKIVSDPATSLALGGDCLGTTPMVRGRTATMTTTTEGGARPRPLSFQYCLACDAARYIPPRGERSHPSKPKRRWPMTTYLEYIEAARRLPQIFSQMGSQPSYFDSSDGEKKVTGWTICVFPGIESAGGDYINDDQFLADTAGDLWWLSRSQHYKDMGTTIYEYRWLRRIDAALLQSWDINGSRFFPAFQVAMQRLA